MEKKNFKFSFKVSVHSTSKSHTPKMEKQPKLLFNWEWLNTRLIFVLLLLVSNYYLIKYAAQDNVLLHAIIVTLIEILKIFIK